MIVARPKEESTVEADGEDDEQIEFGENNESEDDSEFVAGVRIKLMSKAELPQVLNLKDFHLKDINTQINLEHD